MAEILLYESYGLGGGRGKSFYTSHTDWEEVGGKSCFYTNHITDWEEVGLFREDVKGWEGVFLYGSYGLGGSTAVLNMDIDCFIFEFV